MRKIAIVFGCGGHRAQANRFYDTFGSIKEASFFGVTDEGSAPEWCVDFLELEPFTDKYTGSRVSCAKFIYNFFKAYSFLKKNKITTLVSFGPGVAIFVSIAAKLRGCSIIHFETWSKFYSPTKTTKVMRLLTNNIFIQNIELRESIPYGKYVGRF
ncbi:hypothetical protein [Vibrio sp. WXL103]|uniref:hypothetical protein n=1 Tax=Vibrio sp. WXL103 TaxID=3450710 RepID=UPI003EC4B8BF